MRIILKSFILAFTISGFIINYAQSLDPDSLVGTYLGSWTNTTFGSTGGASLESSISGNGSTMQFILDLDGFVGGLIDPDPRTLIGSISPSVVTIDTSLDEGDILLTWNANGVIAWDFTNITTPGFTTQSGIGTGTSQEINLDYTVWFTSGDSAVGTAHLEKQVSSVEEDILNSTPNSYELFNNFPNPFNPSTTIYFSIPGESNVSIKVYNGVGEKVADLFDGRQSRGVHKVWFNASSLPSGVYLYRMTAGTFSKTKKMVLVK